MEQGSIQIDFKYEPPDDLEPDENWTDELEDIVTWAVNQFRDMHPTAHVTINGVD